MEEGVTLLLLSLPYINRHRPRSGWGGGREQIQMNGRREGAAVKLVVADARPKIGGAKVKSAVDFGQPHWPSKLRLWASSA